MTDRFNSALFDRRHSCPALSHRSSRTGPICRFARSRSRVGTTARSASATSSRSGYRAPTATRRRSVRSTAGCPRLAPCLPLPIPVPIAKGPTGRKLPIGVVRLPVAARRASGDRVHTDLTRFACDLAQFLGALYRIDPGDGPPAGPHSFYRGGPLSTYDAETRRSIEALADEIDPDLTTAIWEDALAATLAGTARLGPRRRRRSQPAGSGWPAERGNRLRLLGRRRSRLRHRHRLDVPVRREPATYSAVSSRWTPAPGSAAAAGPSGKPSSSSRDTAKPIRPRPTKPAASSPKSSVHRYREACSRPQNVARCGSPAPMHGKHLRRQ